MTQGQCEPWVFASRRGASSRSFWMASGSPLDPERGELTDWNKPIKVPLLGGGWGPERGMPIPRWPVPLREGSVKAWRSRW